MTKNTETTHPAVFAYKPLWTAFDHEIVTVADSAIALTPATYLNAVRAEMTLEDASIRYWCDGSDPTAAEGREVFTGDCIVLDSATQIADFKAIRTGATSGKLQVEYFH